MKFLSLTVLAAAASIVVGQVTYHNGLDPSKYISLTNNIVLPGTPLELFTRIAETNPLFPSQEWDPNPSRPAIRLFQNPAYCIDTGASPQVGTALMINPCTSSATTQLFVTVPGDFLFHVTTGLCVGLIDNTILDRQLLLLQNCNTTNSAQNWHPANV